MASLLVLSSKASAESKVIIFDFISQLAVLETVDSAVVVVDVWSGTDENPSSMLSGDPVPANTQVSQYITDGVPGVIYKITCTATSSNGQVLVMIAYLPVVDDLL